MGCGGSRVSATDQEAVGDGDSDPESLMVLAKEEKNQKTVQFSTEIQSNGHSGNEGESL